MSADARFSFSKARQADKILTETGRLRGGFFDNGLEFGVFPRLKRRGAWSRLSRSKSHPCAAVHAAAKLTEEIDLCGAVKPTGAPGRSSSTLMNESARTNHEIDESTGRKPLSKLQYSRIHIYRVTIYS
jgi:hypothetical protein